MPSTRFLARRVLGSMYHAARWWTCSPPSLMKCALVPIVSGRTPPGYTATVPDLTVSGLLWFTMVWMGRRSGTPCDLFLIKSARSRRRAL